MLEESKRTKSPCASCDWIKVETSHIIAERDRLKEVNKELVEVLQKVKQGYLAVVKLYPKQAHKGGMQKAIDLIDAAIAKAE